MYLEKVFDYQEAGSIAMNRKHGQLIAEEYTGDGIAVKAWVPADIYARFMKNER